jgi:KaiC/GvpD/RAD55 family RecA-like ATPase
MEIAQRLKKLPENFVISVIVPPDNYEEVNMHFLRQFINKEGHHGIYITINRPYQNIVDLMKKSKIDVKKISFVDCISTEIGKSGAGRNCVFVRSPEDLTELAIAIDSLFEHNKHGFIFIDSLDTLLVYNTFEKVMRFVHFITGKMRIYDVKGVLLGLRKKTTEDLINGMAPFTDRIIQL